MVADSEQIKSDLIKQCAKALFYLGQDGPHRIVLKADEIIDIVQGRENFLAQLQANNIHKPLDEGAVHLVKDLEKRTKTDVKTFIGLLQGVRTNIDFEDLDHHLTGIMVAYNTMAHELQNDPTDEGVKAAAFAAEVEVCFERIHQAVTAKSWEPQGPSTATAPTKSGHKGGGSGKNPGRDRR
jgi:hypothetical protein